MSDADEDFVAFGDGRRWAVAIDETHPDFFWAVTEVDQDASNVVEHVDDFQSAGVAAAKRAKPAVDRAPAYVVPATGTDVQWACRWALESGGVGGLVKAGTSRYLHVEVEPGSDGPVVLDEWDDFVDAVGTILHPDWGGED